MWEPTGAGTLAERVETIELRAEAGMGSILLRCFMPRTREALSVRWWERGRGVVIAGEATVM